ncbi:hypothetical protein RCL1_000846 [Eukaryota sp. TZLM3-RCL]
MSTIRKATHAGSWYSDSPSELALQLATFMNNATTRFPKSKAVLVPHAGYTYSGQTAAFSFNCIDYATTETIIIIGPSHRVHFNNVGISPFSEVETPLGNLTVDVELANTLARDHPSFFKFVEKSVDEAEHSLEMQFPFIRFMLNRHPQDVIHNLKILPLLVGEMDYDTLRRIGSVLDPIAANPGIAFVVSTDFCHFGRRFRFTNVPDVSSVALHKRIEMLDMQGIDAIKSMDFLTWEQYIKKTGNTICGHAPIAIVLSTLSSLGYRFDLIHYAQSNEAHSEADMSVSYCSGSFHSAFE